VLYRNLEVSESDYQAKKRQYEAGLESLIVPAVNAADEAGKLIQSLPRLWGKANMTERRKMLVTMLDAVYVDAKDDKAVVAIKPKPAFRPVFQVATTREGSGIILVKDEPDATNGAKLDPSKPRTGPSTESGEEPDPGNPCIWWRWGRLDALIPNTLLDAHRREQREIGRPGFDGDEVLAVNGDFPQ